MKIKPIETAGYYETILASPQPGPEELSARLAHAAAVQRMVVNHDLSDADVDRIARRVVELSKEKGE